MSDNLQVLAPRPSQERIPYDKSELYTQKEPDLYLILGDKIYPTHLSFMSQCNLISRKATLNQKALLLNISPDNETFEELLHYIYDTHSELPKGKAIAKLIKIGKELQFMGLETKIMDDIRDNFHHYSIFVLFELSSDNNFLWLSYQCEKQFIEQEFSQMKEQKKEMFEMRRESILKVLRKYKELKQKKQIQGFPIEEIVQLIKEYNESNPEKIQPDEFIQKEAKIVDEVTNPVQFLDKQFSCESSGSNDPISPDLKSKIRPVRKSSGKKSVSQQHDSSDRFLDIDCVTSPLVNLSQLEQKSLSFDNWSQEQQGKFMGIDASQQQCEQISERDSDEQEDFGSMELAIKKQNNNKCQNIIPSLKAVPQIHKHFIV